MGGGGGGPTDNPGLGWDDGDDAVGGGDEDDFVAASPINELTSKARRGSLCGETCLWW